MHSNPGNNNMGKMITPQIVPVKDAGAAFAGHAADMFDDSATTMSNLFGHQHRNQQAPASPKTPSVGETSSSSRTDSLSLSNRSVPNNISVQPSSGSVCSPGTLDRLKLAKAQAVENEDFVLAAELKTQIVVTELQLQKKQAVLAEDYARAAELKKEIEQIQQHAVNSQGRLASLMVKTTNSPSDMSSLGGGGPTPTTINKHVINDPATVRDALVKLMVHHEEPIEEALNDTAPLSPSKYSNRHGTPPSRRMRGDKASREGIVAPFDGDSSPRSKESAESGSGRGALKATNSFSIVEDETSTLGSHLLDQRSPVARSKSHGFSSGNSVSSRTGEDPGGMTALKSQRPASPAPHKAADRAKSPAGRRDRARSPGGRRPEEKADRRSKSPRGRNGGRGRREEDRSKSPGGRGRREEDRSKSPGGRSKREEDRSKSPGGRAKSRGRREEDRTKSPGRRPEDRSKSPGGRRAGENRKERRTRRYGNAPETFKPPKPTNSSGSLGDYLPPNLDASQSSIGAKERAKSPGGRRPKDKDREHRPGKPRSSKSLEGSVASTKSTKSSSSKDKHGKKDKKSKKKTALDELDEKLEQKMAANKSLGSHIQTDEKQHDPTNDMTSWGGLSHSERYDGGGDNGKLVPVVEEEEMEPRKPRSHRSKKDDDRKARGRSSSRGRSKSKAEKSSKKSSADDDSVTQAVKRGTSRGADEEGSVMDGMLILEGGGKDKHRRRSRSGGRRPKSNGRAPRKMKRETASEGS